MRGHIYLLENFLLHCGHAYGRSPVSEIMSTHAPISGYKKYEVKASDNIRDRSCLLR